MSKIKLWNAGDPIPIIVDIKKIKCYKCGSTHFQRQSGIEITSDYEHGILKSTSRMILDTRIFCNNCHEELEFKNDSNISIPKNEDDTFPPHAKGIDTHQKGEKDG